MDSLRESRESAGTPDPHPPREMKKEVEESLRAFAQMQKLLKQIAQVSLDLLKERKRQRP